MKELRTKRVIVFQEKMIASQRKLVTKTSVGESKNAVYPITRTGGEEIGMKMTAVAPPAAVVEVLRAAVRVVKVTLVRAVTGLAQALLAAEAVVPPVITQVENVTPLGTSDIRVIKRVRIYMKKIVAA